MYLGTAVNLLGEDPTRTLEELCTSQGMDLNNLAQEALNKKAKYLREHNYTGDFDNAHIAIPVGEGTHIVVPVEQKYYYTNERGGWMQNDILPERATFIAFKDTRKEDGIATPLYRNVVAKVTDAHYRPDDQINHE